MKLSEEYVRKLIREEMQSLVKENFDHEGIKDVVTVSSKMLSALTDFESSCTGAMTNAAQIMLQKLKGLVEDMVKNPGSYLDPTKEQIDNVETSNEAAKEQAPQAVKEPAKDVPLK